MTLPPYLYQNGDPALPPPFSFPGLQTQGFPLKANLADLEALVNRFLNIAPLEEMGFAFAPMAPLVYLTLNTYPKMISEPPPFDDMGFTSQRELQVGIPVVLFEPSGGLLVPQEIGLFSAWLVVDNPWSVITGREVLGFPKVLGWFQLPDDFPNPYPSSVETLVFPQFSPETPLTRELLLEVRSVLEGELPDEMQEWQQRYADDPGRVGPLGPVDYLYGPEAPFAVEEEIWKLIEGATAEWRIRDYQLKQFRDAAEPERACYQAITRSLLRISSPQYGLVLWGLIEFKTWDSLNIPTALGMAPASYSWFPYWIEGDTVLEQTTNLFHRCSGAG